MTKKKVNFQKKMGSTFFSKKAPPPVRRRGIFGQGGPGAGGHGAKCQNSKKGENVFFFENGLFVKANPFMTKKKLFFKKNGEHVF